MSKSIFLTSALIAVVVTLLTQGLFGTQNKSAQEQTHQSVYDRVMASGTIRCGYLPSAIFLDVDPNTKEKSGLVFDLMNQIGKNLNLKIEWTEEVGRGDYIPALKADRFDAYCTAITVNAERAREVDFIDPYAFDTFNLYVRSDENRFENNLPAVNDKSVRIAVVEGDIFEKIAKKFFPDAELIQMPQLTPESDQFLSVATNKADVVISTPNISNQYMKSNVGKLKKVNLEKPFIYSNLSISVKADEYRFRRMIDTAILEMRANGQLDKILRKHDPDNLLGHHFLPFKEK